MLGAFRGGSIFLFRAARRRFSESAGRRSFSDVAMIKSFCQRNRMEHPVTLSDRKIDHSPLPKATTYRYDGFAKKPAATAAYLNH